MLAPWPIGDKPTTETIYATRRREGTIQAVTDFRQLSKIATAVDTLGIAQRIAKASLDKVFDAQNEIGIRQAYERTVEFEYDEKEASRRVQSLTEFLDAIIDADRKESLDQSFLAEVGELYKRLKKLLGE